MNYIVQILRLRDVLSQIPSRKSFETLQMPANLHYSTRQKRVALAWNGKVRAQ